MGSAKTPSQIYISRDAYGDVPCDPELPARALKHRVENQLMKPGDFYRNITVWKLVHSNGAVEYYARENESDEAGFEKAVQLRISQGMTKREAKKDAGAYPTTSGIHSEVQVVAEIYRRPDIRSGQTKIAQVFTEREPCWNCRAFMKASFPVVLYTPFYYYLPSSRTERMRYLESEAKKGKSGDPTQLFFLRCYGA